MNKGDFFQRFKDIDKDIQKLTENIESKKTGLKKLEAILNDKKFVKDVLSGLKNPPKTDPGKYAPLYSFVSEITQDDILTTDEPTLFKPCPVCKKNKPVLVEYQQIYDSPDGDEWRKMAFVVCERDGVYGIQKLTRDNRF